MYHIRHQQLRGNSRPLSGRLVAERSRSVGALAIISTSVDGAIQAKRTGTSPHLRCHHHFFGVMLCGRESRRSTEMRPRAPQEFEAANVGGVVVQTSRLKPQTETKNSRTTITSRCSRTGESMYQLVAELVQVHHRRWQGYFPPRRRYCGHPFEPLELAPCMVL
jgi:hypothetical protein